MFLLLGRSSSYFEPNTWMRTHVEYVESEGDSLQCRVVNIHSWFLRKSNDHLLLKISSWVGNDDGLWLCWRCCYWCWRTSQTLNEKTFSFSAIDLHWMTYQHLSIRGIAQHDMIGNDQYSELEYNQTFRSHEIFERVSNPEFVFAHVKVRWKQRTDPLTPWSARKQRLRWYRSLAVTIAYHLCRCHWPWK